ncbi:hypothetical protein I4F81_007774 [Pyropia yezoensis]|uniref:Uncharacterized protein n=1 Tax=Pyropia yezoensis TaxID=2788 RepID=A0ACC3C551_PYRYE|nr:hypothetical protein I4F81_007774 [Neopyropia yezoensis]
MLCRARVVLLTNGIDWLNCQHNLMTIFNESVNWARIYVFAPKLPSPAPHAALHPLPYANVALDAPVERVIVDGSYADVPAGAAVVIRGENVMLVGEIDAESDARATARLTRVSAADIRRARSARQADAGAFRRRERLEWPVPEDYV